MKSNLIVDMTFSFSLKIVEYCGLLSEKNKFVIANQLLPSGTSIGANIREAQNAESKKDFIHKFKIAAKEIEDTQYWLLLCEKSKNYPTTNVLLEELESIFKVVNKILGTSIKSMKT